MDSPSVFTARNQGLTWPGKVLVLALVLWGLAMIVPDFWRVFIDFGTLGLQVNNDGLIYTDTEEPAKSHGIRKGDHIDLRRMACPSPWCGDLLAVVGGLGGLQYVRLDTVVTLAIMSMQCTEAPAPAGSQKGLRGRTEPCAFSAVLRPIDHRLSLADRVTLFLDQLLGIFFILLAGALVWQRPGLMTWGFFLYALWFNPGQTFVAYASLQHYPTLFVSQEVSQALAEAAGLVGFVVFALCFPHNTVTPRWRAVWRSLPYLGVALAVLQLLGFGATFGFRSGVVARASYLAGYAVQLLVVAVLGAQLRNQTLRDRQRTRWVIWSCFIGLPAFLLADSVQSTSLWGTWTLPEPISNVLYMLNAGIAVAVYHAVRWHRVVDVRFAFSRAATLVTTWVIIGIAIALGGRALEHLFVESRIQEALLIVLVIGLTLLFAQLHERLNHLCDQLFFRHLHRAEVHLRQVEDALAQVDSPEGIDQLLVCEAVTTLGLEAGAVFARCDGGSFERRSPGINWPATFRSLAAGDPLVARLEVRGKPVGLAQIDWPRDSLPPEAPRPALAVPCLDHRTLVAIGLFGAHLTGDDLNAEEAAMLRQLARAAAGAYDHVEVRLLRRQLGELRRGLQPGPGK